MPLNLNEKTFFIYIIMNKKVNCFGLYVGFTVMFIQTIAGDVYREHKQRQHNEKMKSVLEKYK